MAVHSPPTPTTPTPRPSASTGTALRVGRVPVTTWAMGVVGAIAAFLGGFILLGGDNQSIGLGGDVSWQVSDIDPLWGYGLLVAGILAVLAAATLALRARMAPATTVAEPRSSWRDVAGHAGVFVVVNAFLWAQDIALGDGLNYALWITVPWGLGLAVHALSTYGSSRRDLTRDG
jgi:hypothetical protein